MESEKLTAVQLGELRHLARHGSPSAYAGSIRALLAEHASLERELAELREAAARIAQWTHEHGKALCPTAGSSDTFGDGMRAAKQQVRALLPAASEPAKEPSDHGFAVGDIVRVTGDTGKAEHEFEPGTEGEITSTRCDEDSDLVCVTPLCAESWWVHPRDLVLVRKAKGRP